MGYIEDIFKDVLGKITFKNPHTFEFNEDDMIINVVFKRKNWVKKSIKLFIEINLDENGLPNGEFVVNVEDFVVKLTSDSISNHIKNGKNLKQSFEDLFSDMFLLYINNISY